MLKIHESNSETGSARPDTVDEVLPGLSSRWLLLDWGRLAPPQRHLAARLVSLGAAQIRLRCTIHKEDVPPPLLATVIASGDYWSVLEARLAELAESAIPWRQRPGKVQFKAAKVALRWTDEGQKICQKRLHLDRLWESTAFDAAPAELKVEDCRFADGAPFPGEVPPVADSLYEAEVSWSREDPTEKGQMLCGPSWPDRRRDRPPPAKRSWKQSDLDAAIGAYRDDPVHEFTALRDLIQRGSQTAYVKAKSIFGRNAVVRNLGVRGAAMVSRSQVWQALAADLDLPCGKSKPLPLRSYALVPLDEALEERADAQGGSVLDDLVAMEAREQFDLLVRRVKLRLAHEGNDTQFAKMIDAIKVMLDTGKVAPENALTLVELAIEQVKDNRKRVLQPRP
jgi:hypothetical protein